MLSGHGNDIYSLDKEVLADFSSNIVYHGMPKALQEHLCNCISSVKHYPQPEAIQLQHKIARFHNVEPSQVLACNGSTEAFYLLAQLYHGKRSTVLVPSFAEYEDACKVFNHQISFVAHVEFDFAITHKTDLIWLCNPNNPDGRIIAADDIIKLCNANGQARVILDEAYIDLNFWATSLMAEIAKLPNLIIVRSLTKNFGIPGVRLGYICCSQTIIEQLRNIKMPWSVNSLAINAGEFILDNYHQLLPNREELSRQSVDFQIQLNQLKGLEVKSSYSNYFLVTLQRGRAADLKSFLLNNYGFLIRDASNFKGLNESYFRLAVQQKSYNQQLIKAIKIWLGTV